MVVPACAARGHVLRLEVEGMPGPEASSIGQAKTSALSWGILSPRRPPSSPGRNMGPAAETPHPPGPRFRRPSLGDSPRPNL